MPEPKIPRYTYGGLAWLIVHFPQIMLTAVAVSMGMFPPREYIQEPSKTDRPPWEGESVLLHTREPRTNPGTLSTNGVRG